MQVIKVLFQKTFLGGDDTVTESIDSLFTAIYHRFGFLSFNTNEIGIGVERDGVVSLTDAIVSLQVISGISVTALNSNGDADGNGRTGLAEAISVLQTMADE